MMKTNNWLAEYTIPGISTIHREYFNNREAADAFVERLSSSYISLVYQVDANGRPLFDYLSNFNMGGR